MPKTTVVTTTIYLPEFLLAYEENAKHYGHAVDFIVIGDRKTPDGAESLCKNIKNCEFWDVDTQKSWLNYKGLDELSHHLPENSIARRNIGHLIAYLRGADSIIMLDDDNLSIPDQDFVYHHTLVGKTESIHTYQAYNGWFNVCKALEEKHGVEFYARGFPPGMRWKSKGYSLQCRAEKVAVNAGLWLNDPDIDALTRLERRLLTTGMKPHWPTTFALRSGTWSPWNCQNTAISREALPSYFLSPHTGRHLDIWAGYITTFIAHAQGQVIAFGSPLAFHDRSSHNLYKDLEQEIPWIQSTDEFVRVLREAKVEGSSYSECLRSVIDALENTWNHQ